MDAGDRSNAVSLYKAVMVMDVDLWHLYDAEVLHVVYALPSALVISARCISINYIRK